MKSFHVVFATLVVVGYFGFEISNLYRLQYRMEPNYIFDQFAEAHIAEAACEQADPQQLRNFERNFAHVTSRAIAEAAETLSPGSPLTAEQVIDARLERRRSETEAILDSEGCSGANAKRMLKFHQIRARLTLR